MFSPTVLALMEIFFVDGGSATSTPIFLGGRCQKKRTKFA
jgi:hypothetical protein